LQQAKFRKTAEVAHSGGKGFMCKDAFADLNATQLRELPLEPYLRMPEILAGHRVRRHNRFVEKKRLKTQVCEAKRKAIIAILDYCKNGRCVSYARHLLNFIVKVPDVMPTQDAGCPIYEYDLKGLPSILWVWAESGSEPMHLTLDQKKYGVDLFCFTKEHFAQEADHELDELSS
jgi:hypothetical protein